MASKIKKNDEVVVLTGKCKGQRGKVSKVFPDKNKLVVDGINLVKKHVKRNPQANEQGGIVEIEMPIHISNVALLNPTTNKPDRVRFKQLEDGKKVRCYKSTGEVIDV